MDDPTDYELEIGHEKKSYLEASLAFLESKDEAWSFDCSKIRKKRNKDFFSFKCYVWSNITSYSNSLESEIADLLEGYEELDIKGKFSDEYGAGRIGMSGRKHYESYHGERLSE